MVLVVMARVVSTWVGTYVVAAGERLELVGPTTDRIQKPRFTVNLWSERRRNCK